jgi:glycogen debranching enzyme
MIRFSEDVCRNLDASLRREWLETNSIGGFASANSTAALTKWSFNRLFWNETGGYLTWSTAARLTRVFVRIRSWPSACLIRCCPDNEQSESLLLCKSICSRLMGFAASRQGPQYRGRYSGDGGRRNGAYHQGTVWPWLLGPFITAYMKVDGGSKAARTQAEEWLAPLKQHLSDGGLGHISEIFDGDAPHRPVGCIAPAWRLAEILRAAVEDVWGIRAQQSAVPLDVVAQQPSETKCKRAAS